MWLDNAAFGVAMLGTQLHITCPTTDADVVGQLLFDKHNWTITWVTQKLKGSKRNEKR